MTAPEPVISDGVTMASVKFKPATDWMRYAFDTFLASVVVLALVATRGHDAPPAPAQPPAPPVQPAPPDSSESGDPSLPVPVHEAQDSGLPAAAAQYARTLSGTFAEMAKQIRLGKVTDRDGALAIAKAHGDALGTALDALFDEGCDEDGQIVKPKFLYNQLDAAAAATARRD